MFSYNHLSDWDICNPLDSDIPFFAQIKPLNNIFQLHVSVWLIYYILWDADTQRVVFSEAQVHSDAVSSFVRSIVLSSFTLQYATIFTLLTSFTTALNVY